MKRPALLLAAAFALSAASQPPKKGAAAFDEGLGYLKAYIRLDTTNPPGNELKSANYLAKLLEKERIPYEIFVSTPGRANLLARLKAENPTEPPLLLLHHMDVVPANPKEWTLPPFAADEKSGYLWGRGAIDTKTTGILHLMTLFKLKREGVPLNRDVLFLAVADEEAGGRWGAQWMVEKHWEDMAPGFVIDEGGFGLSGVLSWDKTPIYACAAAEKTVFWLRVTAEGKSGHGSMPHSDNPNDILRKALARIEQTFIRHSGRPHELVREADRRILRPRKNPMTEAVRHNTVAVTSLLSWSGDPGNPKVNVIPSRASATLDCRLLPGEDEDQLLEKLKRAVDDDRVSIEVLVRTNATSAYEDYRSPLFAALEESVKRHDPQAVVVPTLMPGATDSRFFRRKGARCYGLAPVVLDEEEHSLMHGVDERVPVDRLEKASAIMYDWVKIFCERKD